MSTSLTYEISEDGERNAIVKIVGILSSGDIPAASPVVVIDPVDYSPSPAKFRIDKISYVVEADLVVYLYWDAASPVMIDTLTHVTEKKK